MSEERDSRLSELDNSKYHRRQKKRKDEIAVGLAATIGFGAAYFITNLWFLIFPLVFVGLIPLCVGISKLLRRKRIPEQKIEQNIKIDKENGNYYDDINCLTDEPLQVDCTMALGKECRLIGSFAVSLYRGKRHVFKCLEPMKATTRCRRCSEVPARSSSRRATSRRG